VALDQSALLEVLDALTAAEVDDRIRQAAQTIYQALIEAELTAVIGAAPNQRTPDRLAQRNGHRPRVLTTSAGDLELRLPSCARGRCSRRCWSGDGGSIRPCSRSLWRPACTASPPARSTPGAGVGADSGIAKGQVSRSCADLDQEVSAFRDRSLAGQTFP
jgi:putative transposase